MSWSRQNSVSGKISKRNRRNSIISYFCAAQTLKYKETACRWKNVVFPQLLVTESKHHNVQKQRFHWGCAHFSEYIKCGFEHVQYVCVTLNVCQLLTLKAEWFEPFSKGKDPCASQEVESALKSDPVLAPSVFLHTVLTGLQNDSIKSDLQSYLQLLLQTFRICKWNGDGIKRTVKQHSGQRSCKLSARNNCVLQSWGLHDNSVKIQVFQCTHSSYFIRCTCPAAC